MYDVVITNGTVIDGTGSATTESRCRDRRRKDRNDRLHRHRRRNHNRRNREARHPRLHRHPHPLRRPGALGHHPEPVATPRHHHRDRRQLRVHDRPAGRAARRLPHADAEPGRGDAARIPAGRRAVELEQLRRVARPARWNARHQHRVHGWPQRHSTPRDGRASGRQRGHRRRVGGDERAAAHVDRRGRAGFLLVMGHHAQRPERSAGAVSPRLDRRDDRAGWVCAPTSTARRSSSSLPSVGSPTIGST